MKNAILIGLLSIGSMQLAKADVLLCRGLETTLRVTEVELVTEEKFLYIQLWDAGIDHATFANLYTGTLGRIETIRRIEKDKGFVAKEAFGSYLKVNLKDRTLEFRTTHGTEGRDDINCKVLKTPRHNGAGLGGGN